MHVFKKPFLIACLVLVLAFLQMGWVMTTPFANSIAYAETTACAPGAGAFPLPTWYEYLPGKTTAKGCEVNTDGLGGVLVILVLMAVFDILMYLAGVIAVIMIIWGGFKLLTSNGEPQKIAAGRTTIFNALVGLVIAIIASQIVGLIAGGLA